MYSTDKLTPVPLFHGASGFHLDKFRPGTSPFTWPHHSTALSLLRDSWDTLKQHLPKIDPVDAHILERMAAQNSIGAFNWQHGALYVTASRKTAVNYAVWNGRYGGELLCHCKKALEILETFDLDRAGELLRKYGGLVKFLKGTETRPILIEFEGIRTTDLSTENQNGDVEKEMSLVIDLNYDQHFRDLLGQQTNFRLPSGCGIVKRVFEVDFQNRDDPWPCPLHEILDSPLWK